MPMSKPNSRISRKKVIFVSLLLIGWYIYLLWPKELARDVEVVGNYAYLALGPAGLRIVDISDPGDPKEIGSYDTWGIASGVTISGQYAFVADGKEGLRIIDVSTSSAPREVGFYNTPGWAEDVAVDGKIAYVADSRSGVLAINIEDPAKPVKPDDYQDFKISGSAKRVVVQGGFVYVAYQNGTLRILDASKPKELKEVGSFDAEGVIRNFMVIGNLAFLAADHQGLVIVDLTDRTEPIKLTDFDTKGETQAVAVGGNYAYLADGRKGLRILDITQLDEIIEVGSFEGAQNALDVAVAGTHAVIADGYEGLRVIEAVVQLEPKQLTPDDYRGNISDLALAGRFAYLASEDQGVRVLDVSQPMEPKDIAYYDTPGEAVAVTVAGDFIYVADRKEGMQILFLTEPDSPRPELQQRSHIDSLGETNDVAVAGNFAYIADGSAGLRVINVTDPASPVEVGAEDTPGDALGIAVLGDYSYIADGTSGLRVMNIVDPFKPAEVGFLDTPGEASAVTAFKLIGTPERVLAYLADGSAGLRVIEVTDPRKPKELGFYDVYDFIQDVKIDGEYVYLACRDEGLRVVKVSDPANIQEIGSLDTPGEARGLALANQYIYIADHTRGLRVADVSNPSSPIEVGLFDKPKVVNDVVVVGNYAYLTDDIRGIRVEDISSPRQPREIGHFDQMGKAEDLTIRDNLAFVAEEAGLRVINIADPKAPTSVGFVGTPVKATAVAVEGSFAYVTIGELGLRIFDISDPEVIKPIGAIFDTLGYAQDVFLAGNYAFIADGAAGLHIVNISTPDDPKTASLFDQFKDVKAVIVVDDFAYLADEENGVWVMDVSKPVDPKIAAYIDTPGMAVDLVNSGAYVFIADSEGGTQAYYVLDPRHPVLVGAYKSSGENIGIAVVPKSAKENEPGHFYFFLASGDQGLQILDAPIVAKPFQSGLYATPGTASLGKVIRDIPRIITNLMTGQWGSIPVKTGRTFGIIVFDIFLFVISFVLWLALCAQFILPVKTSSERWKAINRLFTYLIGRHGPIVHIKEGEIVSRPGELRRHGPGVLLVDLSSAVVLEKQEVPYRLFLRVVLRSIQGISQLIRPTRTKLSKPQARIEGGGLVFIDQDRFPKYPRYTEIIRGVVDLRPQIRFQRNVHAHTADGIEIEADIFVLSTLGQKPDVFKVCYSDPKSSESKDNKGIDKGEPKTSYIPRSEDLRVIQLEEKTIKVIKGFSDELDQEDKVEIQRFVQTYKNTSEEQSQDKAQAAKLDYLPFRFDKERIFAAVYLQAQDLAQGHLIPWPDFSPRVAEEVFRDMLSKWKYDDLYLPENLNRFPLQDEFKPRFIHTVRNLGVMSYQFVKRKDGKPQEIGQVWDESQLDLFPVQDLHCSKVLRDRGVKVIAVGFRGMKFNDVVHQQRLETWRAPWEQKAAKRKGERDREALIQRGKIRAKAQREMIQQLAQTLRSGLYSQEAVAVRVFQVLEEAAADPETRKFLPRDTINMLWSLRQWLLSNGEEPPDHPERGLPSSRGSVPPEDKDR